MNTAYELRLEEFSGPMETLLELIEEKKLEITRVSLAEVTADFLKYIETLNEVSPKILADFLAVATRLILIKSHTLLPQLELLEEEEKEIADLEERLKLYREFRGAEKNIKNEWGKRVAFSRDYLANLPPGFYLTQEVNPKELLREFAALVQELQTLVPEVKRDETRLISLEEKIKELKERLQGALHESFDNMRQGRERPEIIVLFLALLHLLKEAQIVVEQEKLFSDIKIVKNSS